MEGFKQSEVQGLPDLGRNRYENIFTLYENENNQLFYNLKSSVNFPSEIDERFLSYYTVDTVIPWTIASYNIYGTIFLWWTITELNKISNPVAIPPVGTVIAYIKPEYISEVINQISTKNNNAK